MKSLLSNKAVSRINSYLENENYNEENDREDDVKKFYGEIEIYERHAIVSLFDETGEWSGSGRIDIRNGDEEDLYEEGYKRLSLSAKDKGGRLETYKRV